MREKLISPARSVDATLAFIEAEQLTAGLDGEIFLCIGNFRLAGVAVLGNQVTGKAGKLVTQDFSLASLDYFAGAGKI